MSAPERTHVLKTWPKHFANVASGAKRFELRRDDRGFAVGDALELREYDPASSAFTGRAIRCTILYLLRDMYDFGLMPDHCILSLSEPTVTP